MFRKLLRSVLLLFIGLTLTAAAAWAQTGTITGQVTDQQTGQSLINANVFIQSLSRGAATNVDGEFTIEDIPYDTYELRVSYVGYETKTVTVTVDDATETVDIALESATGRLEELVVTALGQKREINELSYSAESVDAEAIAESGTADIFGALSGKVAGLSISGQNGMGASSDIILRGVNSLTGNNQVLFVVDGVPLANSRFNTASQEAGGAGYNFGSTALDINPANIASMTVLKGAAATALYGSRASNGAIIITTKQGAPAGENVSVVFNSTVGFSQAIRETFPTYQTKYGAGYAKYELKTIDNPWPGEVQGKTIQTNWYPADGSWGPAFDSEKMVYDWQSFYPASPHYQESVPYTAAQNMPFEFFETGTNIKNSLFVRGGINDSGYYSLGYSQSNMTGIFPSGNIDKHTLNFSGAYDISEAVRVEASIDYTHTDGIGRTARGYSTIMSSFRQWWQVGTDILAQKRAYFRNHNNITWNLSPGRGGAYFWNNPYFERYQNYETDMRDRYVGYAEAQYDATDWLSFTGRVSYTGYHQVIEERLAVGSVAVGKYNGASGYQRRSQDYSEYNFRLIANYQTDLSEKVHISGLVGFNARRTHTLSVDAITNGGLISAGIYALSNSVNPIPFPDETDTKLGVNGIFASLNVDYNDYLFLHVTARRDKASSLPKENNTYYYPSVSGSFNFSELLETDWLSFGKIRASWARVGSTADPLSLIDTFVRLSSNFAGQGMFTLPLTKANSQLKPEISESYEVGLQLGLFNSRLYLDATYYNSSTFNQIVSVPISRATGYSFRFVNAGKVQNKGVEISLRGRPVVTNNFSWQISLNWTKNKSKLVELAQGVKYFEFVTPQGGVSIGAYVGEPLGVLRGSDYTYVKVDGKKRRVAREDGTYLLSDPNTIIGNQLPDWSSGISNRLTYKNWSLNFLIDVRYGGQIFSLDQWYGQGTGLYPSTVGINKWGNPIRNRLYNNNGTPDNPNDDFLMEESKRGGVVLPGVVGVDINGDGKLNNKDRIDSNDDKKITPADRFKEYKENTTPISAYLAHGYHGAQPQSAYVYDATYVKLREVGITYNLPTSLLESIGGIDHASVSLVGRNLWIIYKDLPYADPEASLSGGNVSGYSGGNLPAIRSVALNIELNF